MLIIRMAKAALEKDLVRINLGLAPISMNVGVSHSRGAAVKPEPG